MAKFEMVTVDFQGNQLLTFKDDSGVVRVAIKPIVAALGLNWSAQYRRMLRDPVLSEGVAIMATPSAGGTQETITLPLDMVNGFLFGISALEVKPELRDGVIAYQRECYRALAAHWLGDVNGKAGVAGLTQVDIDRKRVLAIKTSGQIIDMTDPAQRRFTYAILLQLCQEAGIVPPALDQLGADAPDEHPDVVAFWAAVAVLLANGIKFDHSRDSSVLAINMPDIAKRFAAMGCDVKVTGRLKTALKTSKRPKFITTKNVNSALVGGSVQCWLFDRLPVPVSAGALAR